MKDLVHSTVAPAASVGSVIDPAWQLVPKEPTQAMLEAAVRRQGGWLTAYVAPRESGVPVDSDMSQEDADDLNRQSCEDAALDYRAMLSASPTPPEPEWMPINTLPPPGERPGTVWVIVEGSQRHSGMNWYRQKAGLARTHNQGFEDEDIRLIEKQDHMDLGTGRVTHWLPIKLPFYPASGGENG
jgi:hypothetical protein